MTTKDFLKVGDGEDPVPDSLSIKKRKTVISGSKATLGERGVIYLSNVPNGFYEDQMFQFFSQFGKVTNVRLGRSKKTGNFRGYAFVEFRFAEVAKIVAETMNNYLMFDKLMKCKLVPTEKVRPAVFRHRVNPQKPPGKKARQAAKKQVNMDRDPRQELKRRRKQYNKLQKSVGNLQALGIDLQADLPDIEQEKAERRRRLKVEGKTPVMAIDDSDLDITMKTPPNVRKIKSRQNSAVTSVTPFAGKSKRSQSIKSNTGLDPSKTPTIDEEGGSRKKTKLFKSKK